MCKYVTSLAFWILFQVSPVCAQFEQWSPPKIVPPSPELASLALLGELSAKNHTGAAMVNIPLYELQVGSINLPFSLNYASNGVKLSDVPTQVGLGWNLSYGGAITKIVHDMDDDDSYTIRPTIPNLMQQNAETLSFIHLATNSDFHDTETDEYSFNFPGFSGRFYFDQNNVIRQEFETGLRIERQFDDNNNPIGFIITDTNGTKYFFLSYVERTTYIKAEGVEWLRNNLATGWMLNRIESQEGDYITFQYEQIHIRRFSGPNQTAILTKKYPVYTQTSTNCGACVGNISPIRYGRIDYQTYLPKKITSSNGIEINFTHELINDATQNKRLKRLEFQYNLDESQSYFLKRFELDYDDYLSDNDEVKRFYLTRLWTLSNFETPDPNNPSQNVLNKQKVEFSYFEPEDLPSHRSLSQDYYGYYNGRQNANFYPKLEGFEQYHFGDLGADRNPVFSKAIKGLLKKVTYPTGGTREFKYESHTLPGNITKEFNTKVLSTTGLNLNDSRTVSKKFLITGDETTINISYLTHENPAGPEENDPDFWDPPNGHNISTLYIKNDQTGAIVFYELIASMSSPLLHVSLEKNVQYRMELTVTGSRFRSEIILKYDPQLTNSNFTACGLRVKQIISYDPVTKKSNSQFFQYAELESMAKFGGLAYTEGNPTELTSNHEAISSGVGLVTSSAYRVYYGGAICSWGVNGILIQEECTNQVEVSSSSTGSESQYSGSPVAYRSIIVYDDENFKNGGVCTSYHTVFAPSTIIAVLNHPAGASMGMSANMNGKEKNTTWFKVVDNKIVLAKKIENTYQYDDVDNSHNIVKNYTFKERWKHSGVYPFIVFPLLEQFAGYDIGSYDYMSRRVNLTEEKTTFFNENGENPLTTTKQFTYSSAKHDLPTKILTANSMGETIVQTLKYPSELTNSQYQQMVDKNILSPVVEKSTSSGISVSTPLMAIYNEFESYTFGGKIFFKPKEVKMSTKTSPLFSKMKYLSYDNAGNPQIIMPENGVPIIYIWGYNKTFPVAEVIGVTNLYDVAYTSFEGNDKGGWDYNEDNIIQTPALTGHKLFSGTISKIDLDFNTSYEVTLWSRSSPTINGAAGLLLATRRNWHLFKWEISGVYSVQITGNEMDEVRLYPSGKQMISYSFDPFIGQTSICDQNNNITYFEYDEFSRLNRVRDIDFNIIKAAEYGFGEPISPCVNNSPDWQQTGLKKCRRGVSSTSSPQQGEEEAEEIDQNPCSQTYLETRWINLGITGNCLLAPNTCSPPQKYWDGQTCRTGIKTYVSIVPFSDSWKCSYYYDYGFGVHSEIFTELSETQCMQAQ